MELEIRPARESDAEAIAGVIRRSFLAHGSTGWSGAAVQTFLEESVPANLTVKLGTAAAGLVALHGGVPVGFALMPKPAVLGMLFVEPAAHRQGVGRALWLACLARVRSAFPEVTGVRLNSTAFALPFYESQGFVPQGLEFESGGCRATRMLLPLGGPGTVSSNPSIERWATQASSLMQPYEITTDKSRMSVKAAHAFLAQAYWSPGVPLATVQKAFDNSLCFAVLAGAEQVGFARVVTDKATFAYLADVYVLETHRGKGLAKQLVRAIQEHPDLQGLRRFMLATRDAHTLYARFGFAPLTAPSRFMELHNPNAYAPGAKGVA